ncbi:hypothetical protein GALL_70890 [mine drainage metagenome]|uniref:Uncharacterized protein n=1 Tax=mine drainage metagenome TaxID=410659 RepID=A0A1J5SR02_9ZZZZ
MQLFGEIPVTEQDIELWLDNVPNLSQSKFRREAYRKAYRIEDKIRAAKHNRQWPIGENKP